MALLNSISDFFNLTLPQKFEVFDTGLPAYLDSWAGDDIFQLLQKLILNPSENYNLRKRALAALTDYVMLKKIRARRALTILIDTWPQDGDIFLELQRLKDLYFFYSEEKLEVETILLSYTKDNEAEISSEANYLLGLIKLQEALESNIQFSGIELLEISETYLAVANYEIENRDDALFIQKIVAILRNILLDNLDGISNDLETLASILFQIQAKSISFQQNILFLSLYRSIDELHFLRSQNVSKWLDFRHELTKIYLHFSELQNQKIKDRLAESDVSSAFVDMLTQSFVEPYFSMNLGAHLARVDYRLDEISPDSDEAQFLLYLRELIESDSGKKKGPIEGVQKKLEQIFHYRSHEAIESVLNKISDETNPDQVANAFFELSKPDLGSFLDLLVLACSRLQGNRMYRGACLEDDRNTFIADMLTSAKYHVRDQTRWSTSAEGRGAGEIDIYVQDNKGLPYTIIEALNLDSLKNDYLMLHLDKIFKYDTIGHPANFILVYCTAKRFGEFWKRYCEFIKTHSYPYPYRGFEELSVYESTNRKVCRTDHEREGGLTSLYHLVLDIGELPL